MFEPQLPSYNVPHYCRYDDSMKQQQNNLLSDWNTVSELWRHWAKGTGRNSGPGQCLSVPHSVFTVFILAWNTGYFYSTTIKILFFFFLINLAALGLSCRMQDLVPWPGIEPRPPALGAWNLNHWPPEKSLLRFSSFSEIGFLPNPVVYFWTKLMDSLAQP